MKRKAEIKNHWDALVLEIVDLVIIGPPQSKLRLQLISLNFLLPLQP